MAWAGPGDVVLIRYEGGEPKVCSVVHRPTPEQEDSRRVTRERDRLIVERTAHGNRIKGLLHGQGVRDVHPRRKGFLEQLAQLRTGDGRAVPANLIDNLQIIKAGSPDLVGDFGGGIIRINTKSVPEKFTQHLSIGGQMHSLTTFEGFTEFKKYAGESLNFISSKRDLPEFADNALRPASLFPNSEEKVQFADITKQFNNDWSNKSVNALPNSRLAYSMGFPVRLSDEKKLGVVMALNYANTRRFLSQGQLPPKDAVRTEELINYFRYDYARPERQEAPFTVTTDVMATPCVRSRSEPTSRRPAPTIDSELVRVSTPSLSDSRGSCPPSRILNSSFWVL